MYSCNIEGTKATPFIGTLCQVVNKLSYRSPSEMKQQPLNKVPHYELSREDGTNFPEGCRECTKHGRTTTPQKHMWFYFSYLRVLLHADTRTKKTIIFLLIVLARIDAVPVHQQDTLKKADAISHSC